MVESFLDFWLPGCLHGEPVDRSAVIHHHISLLGGCLCQVLQVSVAGLIIMSPINYDEVANVQRGLDKGGHSLAGIAPDERYSRRAVLIGDKLSRGLGTAVNSNIKADVTDTRIRLQIENGTVAPVETGLAHCDGVLRAFELGQLSYQVDQQSHLLRVQGDVSRKTVLPYL